MIYGSSEIPLGNGMYAIVDTDKLDVLLRFNWRAVKARRNWYAKATFKADDKYVTISMHRFLAKTRLPQICHHRNHNSLDNRIDNLENMSKFSHTAYHRMNNILVKLEEKFR